MVTRIDAVYEQILPMLADLGAEDTTENRLSALEGLRDAWREDPDPTDPEEAIEKTFWIMAVNTEIFGLKMKLLWT